MRACKLWIGLFAALGVLALSPTATHALQVKVSVNFGPTLVGPDNGTHFGDMPGCKVDHVSEFGELVNVLRVSVHRLWVLAMREKQFVPLAVSVPFTLLSILETKSIRGKGFAAPDYHYESKAYSGDRRAVPPKKLVGEAIGDVTLNRVGKGARVPTPEMAGQIANDVVAAWARAVKLSTP